MKVTRLLTFFLVAFAAPVLLAEPEPCEPEPTDMAIRYGDFVSGADCALAPGGDSDTFRFEAKSGEHVRVRVTDQGSAIFTRICIELVGPDGFPTPSGSEVCANVNAEIDEQVQVGGTHRILVSALGAATMPYGLALERLSPRSASAVPICYSCDLQSQIDAGGDVDAYYLSAVAGDRVKVSAIDQGTAIFTRICVELVGPDGLPTPNGGLVCANVNAEISDVALETGHYVVLVTASGRATMPYLVGLQCLAGVCPSPFLIFSDGFESGNTSLWSDSVP